MLVSLKSHGHSRSAVVLRAMTPATLEVLQDPAPDCRRDSPSSGMLPSSESRSVSVEVAYQGEAGPSSSSCRLAGSRFQ